MKWVIAKLNPGDHIRVKREFYYHHGVYIGDDKVVHYTGPKNDSVFNPSDVKVMQTSVEFFAKDGIVEKAQLSFKEKIHKRNNKDILEKALSSLGKGDYDFLHNNCEDFANFCCYKKKLTSQIDKIKESI